MQVTLDTDGTRNRGLLLPFADGLPRVDQLTPLPAELNGEGIVVVSGITTSKKDAPFTVSVRARQRAERPEQPRTRGGCALSGPIHGAAFADPVRAALGLLAAIRLRRTRTRRASSARAAGAVDRPNPSLR